MKKTRAVSLMGLAIVCFVVIAGPRASAGKAGAPKFSSLYTDLNRECRAAFKESEVNQGSDMPLKCKGYGGYHIYIYYSAWASHIAVNMQRNEDVNISLGMQHLSYSEEKGRKVEWRMADGKPFAVIARISKYSDEAGADGGNPFDDKYKTGEALVVKGLKGYEKIDFEVDVKSTASPNESARQMADENYQK